MQKAAMTPGRVYVAPSVRRGQALAQATAETKSISGQIFSSENT